MRSKAFFVNGGAGRVICSIPAFEKYAEANPNDDFIIVCEGGTDFFKGHPKLDGRVYDHWHKRLFQEHIKDRICVSPEPYRVWHYYNQKCNLSQAYDIEINGLSEPRELQKPSIELNKTEVIQGYNIVQEIKSVTKKDKVLVVQPFGRSVEQMGEFIADSSSRSMPLTAVVDIVNDLKKDYAVVIMSEYHFPVEENEEKTKFPIARPQIQDMRVWAAVIDVADHFLGCDSMGQHIARALDKTATVVVGSTYPENISYPNHKDFDILDIGNGRREYSPIRITMDETIDRFNDSAMEMDKEQIKQVTASVRKRMGKSRTFTGTFVAPQQTQSNCCDNPSGPPQQYSPQSQLGAPPQQQFMPQQQQQQQIASPPVVPGRTQGAPKPNAPTPNFTLNRPKPPSKGFKQEVKSLLKPDKSPTITIEKKKG
jgi:ADP-heptose:LPS heptosyltransferase